MIIDSQTNYIFLADSLQEKHPEFNKNFTTALNESYINHSLLPGTKDIWAVDFMPIQVSVDKFVQFTYNPDYLQTSEQWRNTITHVDEVCRSIGLSTTKSNIVLDGGNLIRWRDKIIMTEKVFKENKNYSRDGLIFKLKDLFEIDTMIFIPQQPYDYIGHADGMVRFVDGDTVLVNDYSKESTSFQRRCRRMLDDAGLTTIQVPYNPYSNTNPLSAVGTYTNYLEVGDIILVPTFNIPEDTIAIKKITAVFPTKKIISVECRSVAEAGGALNCITWNVVNWEHL